MHHFRLLGITSQVVLTTATIINGLWPHNMSEIAIYPLKLDYVPQSMRHILQETAFLYPNLQNFLYICVGTSQMSKVGFTIDRSHIEYVIAIKAKGHEFVFADTQSKVGPSFDWGGAWPCTNLVRSWIWAVRIFNLSYFHSWNGSPRVFLSWCLPKQLCFDRAHSIYSPIQILWRF